jgi:hypothetical protein
MAKHVKGTTDWKRECYIIKQTRASEVHDRYGAGLTTGKIQ